MSGGVGGGAAVVVVVVGALEGRLSFAFRLPIGRMPSPRKGLLLLLVDNDDVVRDNAAMARTNADVVSNRPATARISQNDVCSCYSSTPVHTTPFASDAFALTLTCTCCLLLGRGNNDDILPTRLTEVRVLTIHETNEASVVGGRTKIQRSV